MSYGSSLKIAVDKVVESVGKQVVSRGTRAVNAIRNAELDVLKGQRSGRVYRKPHSKATYTASAPGEPPARRSGALRLNWHGEVKGGSAAGETKIVAALESEQRYAGYLENGTSRMAPRPYKDRITEKALPEILSIYSEPYD
ncbi:MAG: hypothetical protein ACLRO4_07580 [Lachnospiraceae bacterium]|nr:MAG: virion morphogenesis family protein [Bacteriophage sp.]